MELLALPTLDHKVSGSSLAAARIQLMILQHYTAQSLPLSSLCQLDLT